jgi:hypothetical protein
MSKLMIEMGWSYIMLGENKVSFLAFNVFNMWKGRSFITAVTTLHASGSQQNRTPLQHKQQSTGE